MSFLTLALLSAIASLCNGDELCIDKTYECVNAYVAKEEKSRIEQNKKAQTKGEAGLYTLESSLPGKIVLDCWRKQIDRDPIIVPRYIVIPASNEVKK